MNQFLDNPKPMGDVTPEYLDKIKKELNCVGIFIVVTDSEMPCPDARAFGTCEHGHAVSSGMHGMSIMGLMGVLSEIIHNQGE